MVGKYRKCYGLVLYCVGKESLIPCSTHCGSAHALRRGIVYQYTYNRPEGSDDMYSMHWDLIW